MIILIGSEKGGTGKSTLTTNMAAMRARAGFDVLLLDTDLPQASSSFWSEIRLDNGRVPPVSCLQKTGRSVGREVRDLASRYDDIIIDAGGRDSMELRACMLVAQRLFIPVQASQFDLGTIETMDMVVGEAQALNEALQAKVIINRAPTNPSVSETEEARAFLGDCANLTLANTVVRERIAFRKAAREGLSIAELTPVDPKALQEIQQLYDEVFS